MLEILSADQVESYAPLTRKYDSLNLNRIVLRYRIKICGYIVCSCVVFDTFLSGWSNTFLNTIEICFHSRFRQCNKQSLVTILLQACYVYNHQEECLTIIHRIWFCNSSLQLVKANEMSRCNYEESVWENITWLPENVFFCHVCMISWNLLRSTMRERDQYMQVG